MISQISTIEAALLTVLPDNLYARYQLDGGPQKAVLTGHLPPEVKIIEPGVELVLNKSIVEKNTYFMGEGEVSESQYLLYIMLWQPRHLALANGVGASKMRSLTSDLGTGDSVISLIKGLQVNRWFFHQAKDPMEATEETPETYSYYLKPRPIYCD